MKWSSFQKFYDNGILRRVIKYSGFIAFDFLKNLLKPPGLAI